MRKLALLIIPLLLVSCKWTSSEESQKQRREAIRSMDDAWSPNRFKIKPLAVSRDLLGELSFKLCIEGTTYLKYGQAIVPMIGPDSKAIPCSMEDSK